MELLKTLPNQLTLARVVVIPLIIILYPLDVFVLRAFCALLFAFAAFTDFLDGYLARKYNTTSQMGALLDPIADKMLVTSAVLLLVSSQTLAVWIGALLLCREVAVSGMRLSAAHLNVTIAVSQFGKVKTALQSVGLFLLMFSVSSFYSTGMVLLWVSLAFSYVSAYRYWDQLMQAIRSSSRENDDA